MHAMPFVSAHHTRFKSTFSNKKKKNKIADVAVFFVVIMRNPSTSIRTSIRRQTFPFDHAMHSTEQTQKKTCIKYAHVLNANHENSENVNNTADAESDDKRNFATRTD